MTMLCYLGRDEPDN